ncbi:mediator of RNA polymerase II transcription subunit 14-like [Rhopilema esculentum]|uniref:mediator of RNA polymerase II transcription subunit 14-like n=1 Tax=Rhopilema esculentum TaxID=499914 RepID=UPI0031DA494B
MAGMQQFAPGTTVNLSMLVDMALQKAYHELTLLSELLPRKSDIGRKIEIIQFATNTRQQFVRLLALVKWAASAEKVDKCQEVSASLDQQNMFFINTADTLARMARETLANARLPNFSLPTAVDVLTTGTFNRLPRCIKEKIVAADSITLADKKKTLNRLNEVIRNRLAVSKIPTQFSSLVINEGRVTLIVKDEFEATLTLMGDQQSIPWRLLKIEFLIKDFETGDGKPLVHNLQIQYIHQLLQSRLMAGTDPFLDVYDCLHYFTMSLQLEVLHTQAIRLINEKWGDLVKVEEYITGQKLVISYWRSAQSQVSAPTVLIKSLGTEPSNLLLFHQPEINNSDDIFKRNAATQLSPSCVAMENILTLAILERSKFKLKALTNKLQQDPYFKKYAVFDDQIPSISIRPFDDCTPSEYIIISIDSRTGKIKMRIDERVKDVIKKHDLLKSLSTDIKEFKAAFHSLRCYIFLAKCASNVSSLPVTPCFYLPFTSRLFLRFNKHQNYALMIDVIADTKHDCCPLKDSYHLLSTTTSDHSMHRKRTTSTSESEQKLKPRPDKVETQSRQLLFSNPESMVQMNPDAFADTSSLESGSSSEPPRKRKAIGDETIVKGQKKCAGVDESIGPCCASKQQLVSMVSTCHIRIPYIHVSKELSRAGIPFQNVLSDMHSEPFIRILELPDIEDASPKQMAALRKLLLVCSMRLHESMFSWVVEYRFSKSPFRRICEADRAKFCVSSEFIYERTDTDLGEPAKQSITDRIRKDWKSLLVMYEHSLIIREYLEDKRGELHDVITVESFDFQTLIVSYGKTRNYKVSIAWSSEKEEFVLHFGITSKTPESNPHQLVERELTREFNKYKNLPYLLYVIVKTLPPLHAISKIPTTPMLGTTTRPLLPMQNFSIVTQSSTHIRIFYKKTHAIDVNLLGDSITVRDGSFCSDQDPSKQLNGIVPAENLTVFLHRFADIPEFSANQTSFDLDISQRDGYQQMHGSPSQSLSASMRSPAFSSPTSLGTAGSTSAGPYSGQLSSLSPANRYTGSSPGFIQPSPAPANSASMTSPASWPHSPQVSQGSPLYTKSSVVPGTAAGSDQLSRSASGSSTPSPPVILSSSSFALLVTPMEQDFPGRKAKYLASPLQRFFDSLYLLKHLQRVIRKDETLHLEKLDILVFSGSQDSGLQYTVGINQSNFETLHLNICLKQGFENFWTPDELRVLKQFFEVVVAPCKLNILTGFARLLGATPRILKDAIKIMRIEMQPEPNQRWFIEWSFMTPPCIVASIAAPGTPAVVLKTKNLFFFQLTDVEDPNRRFVFSILYDSTKNIVQPTEFPQLHDFPQEPPSWAKPAREACNLFLKRIADSVPDQECRLFPTLQTLVNNFVCH